MTLIRLLSYLILHCYMTFHYCLHIFHSITFVSSRTLGILAQHLLPASLRRRAVFRNGLASHPRFGAEPCPVVPVLRRQRKELDSAKRRPSLKSKRAVDRRRRQRLPQEIGTSLRRSPTQGPPIVGQWRTMSGPNPNHLPILGRWRPRSGQTPWETAFPSWPPSGQHCRIFPRCSRCPHSREACPRSRSSS